MGNGQFGVYFVPTGSPSSEIRSRSSISRTSQHSRGDYDRVLYKRARFPYSPDSSLMTHPVGGTVVYPYSFANNPFNSSGGGSKAIQPRQCGLLDTSFRSHTSIGQKYESRTLLSSSGGGGCSSCAQRSYDSANNNYAGFSGTRHLGLPEYQRPGDHRRNANDDFGLTYKDNYGGVGAGGSGGSRLVQNSGLVEEVPMCCNRYTSSPMADLLRGTEAEKMIAGVCSPDFAYSRVGNSKGAQTGPSPWIFIGGGPNNGRFMPIDRNGRFVLGEGGGVETKEIQTVDGGNVGPFGSGGPGGHGGFGGDTDGFGRGKNGYGGNGGGRFGSGVGDPNGYAGIGGDPNGFGGRNGETGSGGRDGFGGDPNGLGGNEGDPNGFRGNGGGNGIGGDPNGLGRDANDFGRSGGDPYGFGGNGSGSGFGDPNGMNQNGKGRSNGYDGTGGDGGGNNGKDRNGFGGGNVGVGIGLPGNFGDLGPPNGPNSNTGGGGNNGGDPNDLLGGDNSKNRKSNNSTEGGRNVDNAPNWLTGGIPPDATNTNDSPYPRNSTDSSTQYSPRTSLDNSPADNGTTTNLLSPPARPTRRTIGIQTDPEPELEEPPPPKRTSLEQNPTKNEPLPVQPTWPESEPTPTNPPAPIKPPTQAKPPAPTTKPPPAKAASLPPRRASDPTPTSSKKPPPTPQKKPPPSKYGPYDAPLMMVNKQSVNKFKESASAKPSTSVAPPPSSNVTLPGTRRHSDPTPSPTPSKKKLGRTKNWYSESELNLENLPLTPHIDLDKALNPHKKGHRSVRTMRLSDDDITPPPILPPSISKSKTSWYDLVDEDDEDTATKKDPPRSGSKPALKKIPSQVASTSKKPPPPIKITPSKANTQPNKPGEAPKKQKSIRFTGLPPPTP